MDLVLLEESAFYNLLEEKTHCLHCTLVQFNEFLYSHKSKYWTEYFLQKFYTSSEMHQIAQPQIFLNLGIGPVNLFH